MEGLRRLWCLLDANNINLRMLYIISPANGWAVKLSRHLDDSDDWKLNFSICGTRRDIRHTFHRLLRVYAKYIAIML
jgi:hypothetical protein